MRFSLLLFVAVLSTSSLSIASNNGYSLNGDLYFDSFNKTLPVIVTSPSGCLFSAVAQVSSGSTISVSPDLASLSCQNVPQELFYSINSVEISPAISGIANYLSQTFTNIERMASDAGNAPLLNTLHKAKGLLEGAGIKALHVEKGSINI